MANGRETMGPAMYDNFKILVIALITSVATTLLLTPYIVRLQVPPITGDAWPVPTPVSPSPMAPAIAASPSASADSDVVGKALGVPNVEGALLDEARNRWMAKGIIIIEDGMRYDSGAPAGTILQQRPPPGAALDSLEIRVVVAKGSEDREVPAVIGRPVDEARRMLVESGFEVSTPEYQASTAPADTVVEQVPASGSKAPRGASVRLVVAKLQEIVVPKVRGMLLGRAKTTLTGVGLVPGKVREVENFDHDEGYVLRQEPAPDEKVGPGTPVDLFVVAPY